MVVDDGGLGIGLGIVPGGARIALATGLDVEIAGDPLPVAISGARLRVLR